MKSYYKDNDQVLYMFNLLLIAAEIRPIKTDLIADTCIGLSKMILSFSIISKKRLFIEVFEDPIIKWCATYNIDIFYKLYKHFFITEQEKKDKIDWIAYYYFESSFQIPLFLWYFQNEEFVDAYITEFQPILIQYKPEFNGL